MKKTYQTPVLLKREKLSVVTAQQINSWIDPRST